MSDDYKQQVFALLKSIETGDPKPLAYINPVNKIVHAVHSSSNSTPVPWS